MAGLLPILTLALILGATPVSVSAAREFVSPITDSAWSTNGDALECRLVHIIDGFGQAVFVRQAGGELGFRLEAEGHPLRHRGVRIRAMPAPWMHAGEPRDLGTLAADHPASPFRIDAASAQQMLAFLGEGYFPTIFYGAEGSSQPPVRVALSAVNFQPAVERFQACADALLPVAFDGLRSSSVHFAVGSTALEPAARQRLDQVAQWMKLDPAVDRATVTGHADTSGNRRQNYLLSQRRAIAVRDYLASRGIERDRVQVRFRGQEQPAASETTAAGRRHNRRVDVRLYR